MASSSFGTRSWNEQATFDVGQVVFVPATYFDPPGGKLYSDCFPFKEKTLLRGKIITICLLSVRIQFEVDGTTSTVKKKYVLTSVNEEVSMFVVGDLETTEAEKAAKDAAIDTAQVQDNKYGTVEAEKRGWLIKQNPIFFILK